MSNPKDIAFNAFMAGWNAAIQRAGGLVKHSWGMSIDWGQVIEEECNAYWREANKVWEAEAEISKQRVAHVLAKEKPLNVLPIPKAPPRDAELGMDIE